MPDDLNDDFDKYVTSAPPKPQREFRTDRNNNPIAAAVTTGGKNQFTNALDDAGIPWEHGDPFPNNPKLSTIRIKGDPYEGARAILSNSNALKWYRGTTGKQVLPKYGVRSNQDFQRLPTDQQNEIIHGIYQSEGGNGAIKPTQDDFDKYVQTKGQTKVQPQSSGDDFDKYVSGQTQPPQTKLNRVNQPNQTATATPVGSRQPSVPTQPLVYSGTGKAFDFQRPTTRSAPTNLIDKTVPTAADFAPAPTVSPTFQQDVAQRAATKKRLGQIVAPQPAVPNMAEMVTRETPQSRLKDQIRAQVHSEMSAAPLRTQYGNQGEDLTAENEEVDRRYQAALRANDPEMVGIRKEYGAMSAPARTLAQPLVRTGAGILKQVGGVTSAFGIAPNQLSDWANTRAQVAEEGTLNAPLNAQGEEIAREVPEKVVQGLADLGLGIGEIVLLKKATGLPFNQLMALESALKTNDKPLGERAQAATEAYAMGTVLDQHLSKPVSAALFGGPTALQSAGQVAKGNMSLEDALIQTGVQAGAGAFLGGKEKSNLDRAQTEAFKGEAPEPASQTQVPDIEGILARREQMGQTQPKAPMAETQNVGATTEPQQPVVAPTEERRGPQRVKQADWLDMSEAEREKIRQGLAIEQEYGRPEGKPPVIDIHGQQNVGEAGQEPRLTRPASSTEVPTETAPKTLTRAELLDLTDKDLDARESVVPDGMTRLYRGGAKGNWFSTDRDTARFHLDNATSRDATLRYVDVPTADLMKYDAFENPRTANQAEAGDHVLPKALAAQARDLAETAPTEQKGEPQTEPLAAQTPKSQAEGVTQAAPSNLIRRMNVNGEERTVELTPENAAKWDALEKEQKQGIESIDRGGIAGDPEKNKKGLAMRIAAAKRQLHPDLLTGKEAAATAKREAGNYINKQVEVDGKSATVIGNPFGRVKVKFEDGTQRIVDADQVSVAKLKSAALSISEGTTREYAGKTYTRQGDKWIRADGRPVFGERERELNAMDVPAEPVTTEPTKQAETPRAATPELQRHADAAAALRAQGAEEGLTSIERAAFERKAARLDKKAQGERLQRAGADPYELIDDIIIHGGKLIRQGVTAFDEWSKRIKAELGPETEEHLNHVWAQLHGKEAEGQPPATTGIARRVEESRRGSETPARGQALGAEESVERGRQLLRDGRDPQEVIDKFKEDGAISAESMALVRAKHEELAREANRAFDAGGLNSSAFKEAEKARADFWEKNVRPMQTAWSNTGRAQQGETAIDTGTFYGLYRGFKDAKGREPTEREAATMKKFADRSAKAEADVKDLSSQMAAELDKAAGIQDLPPEVRKAMNRFVDQAGREARRGKRQQTRKTLDEEAVVIKQNIAQAFQKVKSQSGTQPSGLARLDPSGEITKQVIAYAKNRVKAGVTDIAQLVDDVHSTVKDFASDVTKREITEALLGQGLPKAARTESVWAKTKKGIADSLKAEDGTVAREKLGAKLQANPKGMTTEDARAVWEYARENYVDKGNTDFADIRTKVASDLGISPDTVTRAFSSTKATKRVSDEMWARMSSRRQVRTNAESWVKSADQPLAAKAFEDARRLFFIKATLGHGAVAPFTHAPVNAFIPSRWADFWPNFARTYKFMVKGGAHEQAITDLVNSPNYVTAKRAGLANDPKLGYDEYQSAWMAKTMGKLGVSGNRAFDALKTMRQDMFDSSWNKMAEADRTPEMAKVLAEEVNSSTGASKALSGRDWPSRLASKAMFAAPLEASRWDFLVRDNYRAMKAFGNWKNAKPEERYMAKRVTARNAQLIGVYASLLAANQGLLTATGSDDKVNFTDPTKSDFLAFKIAGHNISPAGGMLTAIRFVGNLMNVAMEDKKPREKAADAARVTFNYGRSKLSPLFGTATDVGLQSDFGGRPLPFSKQEGTATRPRYTWPEYLWSTQTPIPVGEAARDVFTTLRDQGMEENRAKQIVKAIAKAVPIGAVAATGIRITPSLKPLPPSRKETVEPMIQKFRSGRLGEDDLNTAVDKGTITEAEAKRIKHEGGMSVQEADFNKKKPQDAFDTYQRLSPTQQERVKEIMERKAWSLLYSDSMTGSTVEKERKRAKIQRQLDRLGIEPKKSGSVSGMRQTVRSAFV